MRGFPPPGTSSVQAGAFSTTLRWGEAYSARTLLQSHCSSSATIMGQEVSTPVPISVCATRTVTVSSGAIVNQALISGTMASRYQGCPSITAARASQGRWKPTTMLPPTAATEARNSRRLVSIREVFAGFALMNRSPGSSCIRKPNALLRGLGEISQVGGRLVLLGRHQMAVGADEIGFVLDHHVVILGGAIVLDTLRIGKARVVPHHRPGLDVGVVDHRDLVVQAIVVGGIE